MKFILACILILSISSCALAPISNMSSGRTAGKDNFIVETGGIAGGREVVRSGYVRAGYGLFEDFDLGFVSEFGLETSFGIWGKYAFFQNDEGLSASVDASIGDSWGEAK